MNNTMKNFKKVRSRRKFLAPAAPQNRKKTGSPSVSLQQSGSTPRLSQTLVSESRNERERDLPSNPIPFFYKKKLKPYKNIEIT